MKLDAATDRLIRKKYPKTKVLGRGMWGTAYLISKKRVLKVTRDSSEAGCVYEIFTRRLWEKTPYLPRIYEFGRLFDGGPVLTDWYYIREELKDVPLDVWGKLGISDESYEYWPKEFAKLGVPFYDTHTHNWGMRGKQMVLRDFGCDMVPPEAIRTVPVLLEK